MSGINEDTVFTKKGINGTLGIIRADSNDTDGQYHEVIIQRRDQEYDRKKISGDLIAAKEYLDSQWDKYESFGRIKSLKAVLSEASSYKVKVFVHFSDGVLNKSGSIIRVQADDSKEAEKVAREKINKTWPDIKKIEVISITKG